MTDHKHAMPSSPLGLPLALTGAVAATRYVGSTTSGAPVSGTFAVGDFIVTQDGSVYICTVAGTPGTWVAVSGGGGGSALVPTVIQNVANSVNAASLVLTIAAAASGDRLILCVGSTGRDVNAPTCTNVTFTEVLATNFGTTIYASVYVGVVAGGASATTVTITATGINFITAAIYEVADALTPTAGASATLTNTNVVAANFLQIGPIAPARGTFFVFVASEDNGTTLMRLELSAPYYTRAIGGSTLMEAIGYAPGGNLAAYVTGGTTNSDFCAGIVAIT